MISKPNRRRIAVLFGIVAITALVVILGVLVVGGQPASSSTGTDEEVPTPSTAETAIYRAMVNNSIPAAVVDISNETILVRYNVPPNRSREHTTYYVLGVASSVAPKSDRIRVEVYENFVPIEAVVVETTAVQAYRDDEVTFTELTSRVERRPLSGSNTTATPELTPG